MLPRSSIFRKSRKFASTDQDVECNPDFLYDWSLCQFDDITFDIEKIEKEEKLLTGGYESSGESEFEDLLYEYYLNRPSENDIAYRKPLVGPVQKIEVRSTLKEYIKGKRSYYFSQLFVKRKRKRRRRRITSKTVLKRRRRKRPKPPRIINKPVEQLVIKCVRVPPPSRLLKTGRYQRKTKDKTLLIRKNLTTILREAASLLKEEKKEQEKMLRLLEGAPNYCEFEKLMKKRRKEDEERREQKLIEGRLKAQLAYQSAILKKQRLPLLSKVKRKEFDDERKKYLNQSAKRAKRIERRRERIKNRILRTRSIVVQKKSLLVRKKNLHAAGIAWHLYRLACEAYDKLAKEYKKKKSAIRTKHLLKKVFSIQKCEIKPMKDIEFVERSKLAEKHKLEEYGYKKEQIKQIREFNTGIRKFASKYVTFRRRKRLLGNYYQISRTSSIKSDRSSAETFQNSTTESVIDCGKSILDSFEQQIDDSREMRPLVLMKQKLEAIKDVATKLTMSLTRITEIKLRRHVSAFEEASFSAEVESELEKAKSVYELYPSLQRKSSLRSSIPSSMKPYFLESSENCEYSGEEESMLFIDWELLEMRQKKIEEKQAIIEEEAQYISELISAIEIYYMDFLPPPLIKKPPTKLIKSAIYKLQHRLDQIKREIFKIRHNQEHSAYSQCSEPPLRRPSINSVYYAYARDRFKETPVLNDQLKKIKFMNLNKQKKKVVIDQSDTSLSQGELSVISSPPDGLLAEIKYLSKKEKIRGRSRRFYGKGFGNEVQLTIEEEEYLKTQPPDYKLYINQWGNPIYELKIKNEFRYMWEWVPIVVPKSAEQSMYQAVTEPPYPMVEESVDSNDSAILLTTKEHNAKYFSADLFDKQFIENNWKKRLPEFSHLPKEVRRRYLNSVQRYVSEYYRHRPKGGRPEEILVHIPLGEIEQEYLYFINKQKTKTGKGLKDRLREIEKQLGIYMNNKKKHGKAERRRKGRADKKHSLKQKHR